MGEQRGSAGSSASGEPAEQRGYAAPQAASVPRGVRLLEVVPGPAGVAAVWAALPDALAGVGPALGIAPSGPEAYAERARATVLGHDSGATTDDPEITGGVVVSGGGKRPHHPPDPGVAAEVAVVLATSGSTGHPRGVLLPSAALLASAHAVYSHFVGPGAWLLALPVTGIGGLAVLVRSLVAQVDPVVLGSVGGASSFDPREFAEATWRLDPSLPAYTSLVPAQAARLLEHPDGLSALRAYEVVLLGGARTPPPLLDRLLENHVAAVTSYGMTETCGGTFYDGVALPGVDATILDPDADGLGRITLRGPMLARGYLADETATAAAFVHGRLVTNDVGRLHGADLEVLGRIDDVVQIGGVNVAVSAVQDLLGAYADDVCVLATPDETWGHVLTAYVVGATADDDALATAVGADLGRPAVPRAWVRLDAIPHLPNGKPDRVALAARAPGTTFPG